MTVSIAIGQPLVLNVRPFGARFNNSADDTADLQDCLNAAGAATDEDGIPRKVEFPSGRTAIVSATLKIPDNVKINGNGATIKVADGTGLTTPVLASKAWYDNNATSGYPIEVSDLKIDGNSNNGGTTGDNAHGIVSMNYQSVFTNIEVDNVTGDGHLLTAHSQNGTHITNTCNEMKFIRCIARNIGKTGIHVQDDGSTRNSCTDGFIVGCVVADCGARGIDVEMAPGWLISECHPYSIGGSGITVNKCYATRVVNNYIEGVGADAGATYVSCLAITCIDGRGSTVSGNQVSFAGGTAVGPFIGIAIAAAGSARSICEVVNNTVEGGSQGGSLAYTIQAFGDQPGNEWKVYWHDNDATATANYWYRDGNETLDSIHAQGELRADDHIMSRDTNTPAISAGWAAGSSPPTPTISGNDTRGLIGFGVGTGVSTGSPLIDVIFSRPYSVDGTDTNPRVMITAANGEAAKIQSFVDFEDLSNGAGFHILAAAAITGPKAADFYQFMYWVIG